MQGEVKTTPSLPLVKLTRGGKKSFGEKSEERKLCLSIETFPRNFFPLLEPLRIKIGQSLMSEKFG